jgi:hypothetical protein
MQIARAVPNQLIESARDMSAMSRKAASLEDLIFPAVQRLSQRLSVTGTGKPENS